MSKLPNYQDFLNESNASMDLMKHYYELVKKINKASITKPLNFQRFDKEFFFEFKNGGNEHRVHYTSKDNKIYITNMNSGDEREIRTDQEFMDSIS